MKVYKCTNQVNCKVYVGCTKHDIEARWNDHVRRAIRGSMYPFHCAIRKYGAAAFIVEIVQDCQTLEKMSAAEVAWISRLDSANRRFGYNATLGGNDAERTPETRMRMRRAVQRRRSDEGYRSKCRAYASQRSDQHRERLGISHGKRVEQLSFDGQIIATYLTLAQAQRATGVASSSISLCCNGKRIRTAGGFTWRFT